jgi:hypothetical protein
VERHDAKLQPHGLEEAGVDGVARNGDDSRSTGRLREELERGTEFALDRFEQLPCQVDADFPFRRHGAIMQADP